MSNIRLLKGDCLQKLKELEDNSIDSVVTDPPYGLEFMGKEWDSFKTGRISKYKEGGKLDIEAIQSRKGKGGAGPSYTKRAAKRCKKCGKQEWSGSPCKCELPDFEIDNSTQLTFQEFNEAWARECYRVLKPGGHLLAFAGSRMYHRLAVGVEDAGFEIRDQIMWIYGSGFPKSHNIGKAVDKLQGNEREVVGSKGSYRDMRGGALDPNLTQDRDRLEIMETKGNSPYEGWGTALKPAHEPIVMARKPFKGSVAQNVLEWGTGGINIDGCRVGYEDTPNPATNPKYRKEQNYKMPEKGQESKGAVSFTSSNNDVNTQGRFPANIIFDEEAGKILDEQSGTKGGNNKGAYTYKDNEYQVEGFINNIKPNSPSNYGDTGGASRFFYCPKASKKDRNEGNIHPTVKPTDLMAYLVRLVTPKGGTVLDPFMGSGSTGKASVREGMDFIGIEREDEYMEIAKTRIEHEQSKHKHREFFNEV